MKRAIYLLVVLMAALSYSTNADAQLLKKLGERVKNTVENKVLNKAEEKVSEEMDEAMGDKKSNNKQNNNAEDGEEAVGSDEPIDFAEIQAKSDFKRGGTVFFNDDLKGEQLGEFPSKWDLLNGSECEVVNIKGMNAIKIEGTQIKPLMEELKYLPEEFTIEFDVLSQPAQEGSGWDATLDIFFFGDDYEGRGEDRVFVTKTSVETANANNYAKGEYDAIAWDWTSWNPSGNEIQGETSREGIRKVFKKNDWNHIAFSFNKRAFKMYLNYSRIVNIPSQKQPRTWSMEGRSDSDKGVYITNIVMAKGAVDLYERNATDYSSAVEKALYMLKLSSYKLSTVFLASSTPFVFKKVLSSSLKNPSFL